MPISKTIYIYGLLIAGSIFTAIGGYSIIYTETSVQVDIDGVIEPNHKDILSPDMKIGDIAFIDLTGSIFNLSITYPNETTIHIAKNTSRFIYNFTADQNGEHFIEVNNFGNNQTLIDGYAYTLGNEFALIGQIMLVITGLVILYLGIRTKQRG